MNTKAILWISVFIFFCLCKTFAQVGFVSDVEAEQRNDGSGLVDISYLLNGADKLEYIVDVEVSFDSGQSWKPIERQHLKGDLARVIPSSDPKKIVWDGLAGFPDVYSEETKVRVNIRLAMVVDHEGNSYPVTIIGNQEWMAANLRVTTYRNGDRIPINQHNDLWTTTSSGACDVYPNHFNLDTRQKVLETYGVLYNWYAAADSREICPVGWRVPSNSDWETLIGYIMTNHNYHNNNEDDPRGVGNALKSCRSVNSRLGGDCNTGEYPRWDESSINLEYDPFGFSAFAAGARAFNTGNIGGAGNTASFWSSNQLNTTDALYKQIRFSRPDLLDLSISKRQGISVRCVRDLND